MIEARWTNSTRTGRILHGVTDFRLGQGTVVVGHDGSSENVIFKNSRKQRRVAGNKYILCREEQKGFVISKLSGLEKK